ncbi:hypothetical protein ACFL6L_03400 [candidate division KSB1 bacterium]
MTIEEAIKTAIEYEERVRDIYYENAKKFHDATARKIFTVLGEEEQKHVDYLEDRLEEWQKTGSVTVEKLDTVVPDMKSIDEHVARLQKRATQQDFADEIEMFKKALELEVETSNYYKRLVRELPAENQELFEQFVAIEEGHEGIVQAEINAAQGLGVWFDFMEFDLEAG